MGDFHFLRPLYFLGLLPFFSLWWLLWRQKRTVGIWNRLCASHLLPHLLYGKPKRTHLSAALLMVFGIVSIGALAGPTWERVSLPALEQKSGLVIALDLSTGMLAEDVKPSRLQRSLYKIKDLLQKRKEGQTALIVYTDEPFVVTPLTDDVHTIAVLLPTLEPAIMPTEGLRHDRAIAKADDLLIQAGITNGRILLITTAATEDLGAVTTSTPVSILGVGTAQGAPIPKKDGGFVLDRKGSVIISKLEQKPFKQLTQKTGGRFAMIRFDDGDIDELLSELKTSGRYEEQGKTHTKWLDQGYWLVLLCLPLAAYLLRHGQLGMALFFLCLATPLHAFSWKGLWTSADQQGALHYEQGEYEQAAELFNDPSWKAAAYYQTKNYEAAAALYEKDQSDEGFYNYGNTLAQQGRIEEAIAAYAKALEINPDHEDASYNKKVLEELQKQGQDQEQSQEKQQQDQEQSQKDVKGDNQSQESTEQGQSQESQDQDQSQNSQEANAQDEQREQPSEEEQSAYRDAVWQQLQQQEQAEGATAETEQDEEQEERRRIDERWLQRIPDDPGGLLRRKFLYQYRKRRA